jgi:hypothetical protein
MNKRQNKTRHIHLRISPSLHEIVFSNTKKYQVSKLLHDYLETTYKKYV